MTIGRRLLKIDVLRQLQDLDDKESGPEEDTLEEQEHSDEDDGNEDEIFFHNVGIDYEMTMTNIFRCFYSFPPARKIKGNTSNSIVKTFIFKLEG